MVLLDTHTMIWMLFDSERLSDTARVGIEKAHSIGVSVASLWEIAIKQSIGKIDIDCDIKDIEKTCNETGIIILPITASQLDYIKVLPKIHGDPFDRLIIAQAVNGDMTIITKDSIIPQYDVQTLW